MIGSWKLARKTDLEISFFFLDNKIVKNQSIFLRLEHDFFSSEQSNLVDQVEGRSAR